MASGQLPRSFKSKTRKNFWFFKTWKLSKCTFFNKTKEESNIYFGEFSSKLNEVFHLLLTVIQKKYEIVFVKIIVSLCQRPLLNIFFLFLCFLFFFLFFFSFFFRDRVSLCSPGCPGTHSVDQAGLELRNLPASASQVLEIKACNTTSDLNSNSYFEITVDSHANEENKIPSSTLPLT